LTVLHREKGEPTDYDEELSIIVGMGDENMQYNNIICDFTGTPLENIVKDEKVLSQNAGNRAYLLGLIGLMPKMQFPTLENLYSARYWKILKAELVIEPVKTSYDEVELPSELILYETNRRNDMISTIKNLRGEVQVGDFYLDNVYKEDTEYTFDITSYIVDELSDYYVDYKHGLLLSLQAAKFNTTVDRLLVETNNEPVKLRLYYLSY
jgi:hypothetical protein